MERNNMFCGTGEEDTAAAAAAADGDGASAYSRQPAYAMSVCHGMHVNPSRRWLGLQQTKQGSKLIPNGGMHSTRRHEKPYMLHRYGTVCGPVCGTACGTTYRDENNDGNSLQSVADSCFGELL